MPDISIVRDGWAQLGFCGLLLAFGWWLVRQQNAQLKTERDRNQALTDKVISMAESMAKTAAELTNAVKGIHP